MRLLRGVRFGSLDSRVWAAVCVAEGVWMRLGATELVVTSIMDSTHSARSFHYSGRGVDLRTQDPAAATGQGLGSLPNGRTDGPGAAKALARELGPDFQVVAEPDHVHVEYQPLSPQMTQTAYEALWDTL